MNTPIRMPAYAADTLNESVVLVAPEDWHPRIVALGPRLCYGPNFSRGVLSELRDMSDTCVRGYSAVAYDHLLAAERIANR